MALRPLIITVVLLMSLLVQTSMAVACFGPKLYVGVAPGLKGDLVYALVTLYIQEKTGVESLRVDLEPGQDVLVELAGDRLDLAFSNVTIPGDDAVLKMAGYPMLIPGKRPKEDLQFTTVLPAIRKLSGLLTDTDLAILAVQVRSGTPVMAAVRAYLMERRWI